MTTTTEVCFVPRWAGTQDDDYGPWLARALRDRDTRLRVAPLLPSPDAPTIAATVRSIDDAVLAPARPRTVLVAHSVGCQAALRWLAQLPDGERVRALVCVAGWWSIDEPWDTIEPFIEEPFDIERAKRAAGETHVFLSDNDPYTTDHTANAVAWRTKMGATIHMREGRAHFNDDTFEDLLELLEGLG